MIDLFLYGRETRGVEFSVPLQMCIICKHAAEEEEDLINLMPEGVQITDLN